MIEEKSTGGSFKTGANDLGKSESFIKELKRTCAKFSERREDVRQPNKYYYFKKKLLFL